MAVSISYQNVDDHPQFLNIVARLAPIADELNAVLEDRRVEALLAIGSVPAAYATPDSDLDLFALTAVPPRYMHYFARGKINVRETDQAHMQRELEIDPALSLIPMALIVLPYAVIYLQPAHATEILAGLNDLRTKCLVHILHEVQGEIRYGQHCAHALHAAVSINPEDALGYWVMFTSLTNPHLAMKLDRLRARPRWVMTALPVPSMAGPDWQQRELDWCLVAQPSDPGVSYWQFGRHCLQTTWRRFHPSPELQAILWRTGQQHYPLHEQLVHRDLPLRGQRFTQALRTLVQSLQTLRLSAIRRRYGRLGLGPGGWHYDGVGCLARSPQI